MIVGVENVEDCNRLCAELNCPPTWPTAEELAEEEVYALRGGDGLWRARVLRAKRRPRI